MARVITNMNQANKEESVVELNEMLYAYSEFENLDQTLKDKFQLDFKLAMLSAAKTWWERQTISDEFYKDICQAEDNKMDHFIDNAVQEAIKEVITEIQEDLTNPWAIEDSTRLTK